MQQRSLPHLSLLLTGALVFSACATTPQGPSSTSPATNRSADAITSLAVEGKTVRFMRDQLIVQVKDTAKFDAWLKRTGGTVISDGRVPLPPNGKSRRAGRHLPAEQFRLVSVIDAPSRITDAPLSAQNMQGLSFYDASARRTMAVLQAAENDGVQAELNVVMQPADLAQNSVEGAFGGAYHASGFFWELGASPGANIFEAWNHDYFGYPQVGTNENVNIAIIDTGFRSDDPEISGYDPGTNSFPLYQRFLWSYDFPGASYYLPNTADTGWHGLAVARTALGARGNRYGSAGTAPLAFPMLFRINPSYDFWSAAQAVNTAVAWGADVINMSFGGWRIQGWDQGSNFGYALQNAYNQGVVNVASVGNDGVEAKKEGESLLTNLFIPAAWPTVIGVGAIDSTGQRVSYSNFGGAVSVYAPGKNIGHSPTPAQTNCWDADKCASIDNNLPQLTWEGTSFAAPMVAGVAALMKQANPALNLNDVRNILVQQSVQFNGLNVLDGSAAVKKAAQLKGLPW